MPKFCVSFFKSGRILCLSHSHSHNPPLIYALLCIFSAQLFFWRKLNKVILFLKEIKIDIVFLYSHNKNYSEKRTRRRRCRKKGRRNCEFLFRKFPSHFLISFFIALFSLSRSQNGRRRRSKVFLFCAKIKWDFYTWVEPNLD